MPPHGLGRAGVSPSRSGPNWPVCDRDRLEVERLMEHDFSTCARCNGVFLKIGVKVCQKCQEDEARDFEKMRDTLLHMPGLNVEQLAQAAGVSAACVFRMIEEEKISNIQPNEAVTCGRCGAPALSIAKRLCEPCLIKLDRECAESIRELKQQISAKAGKEVHSVHQVLQWKREKAHEKGSFVQSPSPRKTRRMSLPERIEKEGRDH